MSVVLEYRPLIAAEPWERDGGRGWNGSKSGTRHKLGTAKKLTDHVIMAQLTSLNRI